MAADTGITWGLLTRLAMYLLMALSAQSKPVINLVPELWEFSERFDVVRYEISPAIVAAPSACKSVPDVHVKPPTLIFRGESQAEPLAVHAVLVGWAGWATQNLTANPDTDSLAFFRRTWTPAFLADESRLATHILPGCLREPLAFHAGLAALPGSSGYEPVNGAMDPAVRGESIRSVFVFSELGYRAPRSPLATPLHPGSPVRSVLFNSDTEHLRSADLCTLRCSSHRSIVTSQAGDVNG